MKNLTEKSYIFDTPKGFVALDARDGAAIKALLDQIRDTSADLYTTIEENARLYVEVERLRAQWGSVPWRLIDIAMMRATAMGTDDRTYAEMRPLNDWLHANRPEAQP